MSDRIRDFRVTVRLHNNQIKKRREDRGLTAREAADAAGVPYKTWLNLESFKYHPLRKINQGWTKPALAIASFFGVLPDDLWPEAIKAVKANRIEMEVEAASLLALASATTEAPQAMQLDEYERNEAIDEALAELRPREALILRKVFGFDGEPMTFTDVADELDISATRIAQIHHKAMRKLAKNANASPLMEWKTRSQGVET